MAMNLFYNAIPYTTYSPAIYDATLCAGIRNDNYEIQIYVCICYIPALWAGDLIYSWADEISIPYTTCT